MNVEMKQALLRFLRRLQEPEQWKLLVRRKGLWIAASIVNAGCAIHLFGEHVCGLRHVSGPSMLPTMAISGELVFEDKFNPQYRRHSLRRGDLLVFSSPLDPRRQVCKRLFGLPGDVVCVDPTGERSPSTEHVVVPEGHVWVTGDNAAWMYDSSWYGPVPMGMIRGRLVAKVRPWQDRRWFRPGMAVVDEV